MSLIALRAERDRTAEVRSRWATTTPVWVAGSDLDAGHLLREEDLVSRRLPPAALPTDAAHEPPFGRRLRDSLGEGEIVRLGRLDDSAGSANGSRVGTDRGAIALNSMADHLTIGDRVDLFGLLDGHVVAADAHVIDMADGFPVVAVDVADLPAVIRAFSIGDVVPVLVG